LKRVGIDFKTRGDRFLISKVEFMKFEGGWPKIFDGRGSKAKS